MDKEHRKYIENKANVLKAMPHPSRLLMIDEFKKWLNRSF